MVRKLIATCALLAPLFLATLGFASPSPVTVTGQLQTGTAAGLQGNAFVRFRLRNYAGFVPRVIGTGIIVGVQVDAQPDTSGNISTTIWANDDITPNTCGVAHDQACTWYTIEFWNDGKITSSGNYCIPNTSSTFDLNSATPCQTPPLPPPPLNNGGGSGSLTSFAAHDLIPLFTTSVASPTTTPILSFVLNQAPANTVWGNFSSSAATPSYQPFNFSGNTTTAASTAGLLSPGDIVVIDGTGNFIDGGTGPVNTCPTGVGANAYYATSAALLDCDLAMVDDGSGGLTGNKFVTRSTNGGITGAEGNGSALTPGAGTDLLYPSASAHWWVMNNNNAGVEAVAGISGAITVGHVATFKSATEIQDGGTGGTGFASLPAHSVQISTTAAAFDTGGVRYVNATNYMWSQSPSGTLTAATPATITLTPCPAGVDGTDTWNYVRIATTGTPEDTLITGGTCTGGAASGTVTITPANSHTAGYTIASSTQGFQEAFNDARIIPANPTGGAQSGVVVASPGEYTWTARASIRASLQVVDFSGTIIDCNMADTCLMVGNPSNLLDTLKPVVKNFRARAVNAAATIYPALEDNASGATIDGVSARNSLGAARFGYLIQVDGDEAASISHVDPSTGTNVLRCDATFCGAAIYAPGPFASNAAVGYIHDSNLTLNCGSNGIDWQAGNTLHVENTVIQGYGQFGVRTGVARGGFGGYLQTNVYMEGGCSNPAGNIGTAGLILQGFGIIRGGEGPAGAFPVFNSQGGTQRNYFVVITDSVLGPSAPLPIGQGSPTSGTISLKWPQVTGTNTITYDVLATSGAPSTLVSVVPTGTANQAVAGAVGISGSCSGGVCSATDTFATPLASYSVAQPSYYPAISFWPGNIVLSAAADSTSFANVAVLYTDANLSNTVSETGFVPTVFATRCGPSQQFNSLWVSCMSGDSAQFGAFNAATLMEMSAGNGQSGLTGRLGFASNRNTLVGPGHIITLLDSNPVATTATALMRRGYSPNDSYIGVDIGTSGVAPATATLAIGTPVALSRYIAANPDGTSWLERLTATVDTFKVPLNISNNYIDITERAAPSNPAASTNRFYADSTSHALACLTSSGGSCISAGGGGGTVTHTAGALTANALVLGNGAADVTVLGSLGTTTTVLHGNAAGAPSFSAIVNGDITNGTIDITAKVTGILPTANGGTANAFFTVSGPSASAKTFTFPNASANVLTDNVLVTLAQGGLGIGSGTSGGIPGFTATNTVASSALLTANSPVLGGGAGATPKTVAGWTFDGTSKQTLGVAGTSVGATVYNNATSGSITVQPTTGALGSTVVTLPAFTGTAVVAATSTTTTQALFATSTAGAPAYRALAGTDLPTQYTKLRCQPGLGDGLNAMPAGTYLESTCYNDSGVTWTITRIGCGTDNSGSSTLAATNGAGTALLTGAVTCTSATGGAAGTQSGTTTITNGDWIKFTFVADGTSKQAGWFVSFTQ